MRLVSLRAAPCLVALLSLSLLATCNGGGGRVETARRERTTTTAAEAPSTTSTTSTTAPRSPEQVVIDDYLAGWDAVLAASLALDPDHPALVELYREDALELTQRFIRGLKEKNRTIRGTITHDIQQVTIDGTEAVLLDCTDDQTVEYDADGRPVEPPEGPNGRDNRLRLEDGRWRTVVIYDRPQLCQRDR